MKVSNIFGVISLIISMTSSSLAYIVPGPSGGGGKGHQPNPPRYQDDCDNYYRPCDPGQYPPPVEPYPGDDYPPYPDYPDYPDYAQQETKSAWVGRSVRNERLPLRQLVGLDSQYRGWEVVSVRASTRPNSGGTTTVRLLADGRIVASQTNPGYQINLYPQSRLILGSGTQGLQLEIVGSTIIDSIEVEVMRRDDGGYNPPPPPPQFENQIDIPLYTTVYGNSQLDLNPYVEYYRYNGYRIDQIIVDARTSSNSIGIMDFLVNGFNMGSMQFNNYSSRQSLYLSQRPVIGRDASSLVLMTRGSMSIDRVTLTLSRY